MRLYWDYSATVMLSFTQCKFIHLPREENQVANALATLASIWESRDQIKVKPLILMKSRVPCYEEIRVMPVNTTEKL